MYIVKAFYTNGASQAAHNEISLAWPAFSHTVMSGLHEGNLVRAEMWDTVANKLYSDARLSKCPLAVFDLALVEERFSPNFRELELTRNAPV